MMKASVMKRGAALLLALLLTVGLTACAGGGGSQGSGGAGKSIGIIQLIENGAFNDMREGLVDYLRANGYGEDALEIHYKNAQGDVSNLNAICQEMVDKKVDLVVTIATPSTQAMVNMGTDIPVVFASVSDPIGAGVMSSFDAPDKNCTGSVNVIPVGEIFSLAEELTPECATFGLLYTNGEANALFTVGQAKEHLDARGLQYEEVVVSNSSEVQQAAQLLASKVDAMFCPNDSTIQNAMDLVAEVAKDAGIPLYGSSAVMVNSGAFATVAVSDREIGEISAAMVIEHFGGKDLAEIPAVVVPANDVVINRTTAEALGIPISDEVEAKGIFLD